MIVPEEMPDDDDVCVEDDVDEPTVVDEGMRLAVEDGESLLRQLVSLERPTIWGFEDPPERPWASVIVKTTVVPAATLATHVKLVSVACSKNTSPPGITP